MTNWFRKGALGLALAATATMAAAPAEARDRWGRHRGGGDDAEIAIAAGIAGLAIGAAVSNGNRGRYYNDRSYYPQSRQSYYYNSYPQYNGYYYNNHDRRYRDYDRYDRYERNHERRHWRDRDRRWGY